MDPNPWNISTVTIRTKTGDTYVGGSAAMHFDDQRRLAHVQLNKGDHFVEVKGEDVLDIVHA